METKVAAIVPAPDAGFPTVQPNSPGPQPDVEAKPAGSPDLAEMRLVIELDQASGSYVYKTINRTTGEVVQQLPRDEILRLRGQDGYAAGAVIRTKA